MEMLWDTGRHPRKYCRSFFHTRRRSRTEAVGLRVPVELTHSTRFFWASLKAMCFLLRGSPSQSLAKQMMSLPSIKTVLLSSLAVPCKAACFDEVYDSTNPAHKFFPTKPA